MRAVRRIRKSARVQVQVFLPVSKVFFMRHTLRLAAPSLTALIFLLALSACSGGGRHHAAGRGGGDTHANAGDRGGARSPSDMFTRALALKSSRDCRKAEAPLKRLAAFGGGFEIAQFHLADCLLRRAKKATGAERTLLTGQGLHWLELSARSDEPRSQALLVEFHMDVAHKTPDVLAAATWSLIFNDNGKRNYIETVVIAPAATARLDAAASDEIWAEAEEAARAFRPEIQEAKAPDAAYPGVKQSGTKARGGRGRGGKGGGGRGGGRGGATPEAYAW